MSAPEHTPLPWDYVASTEHHGPYITSDHGGTIADLYVMSKPGVWSTASGGTSKPISFFHEMADPNAALIVRCVNVHADLVAALQKALEFIDNQADVVDGGYGIPAPNRAMQVAREIREALAKNERNAFLRN